MRMLVLTLLSCGIVVSAADVFPDDAELVAMAKRRLSVGDIGLTVEQLMARQTGREGMNVHTATIVARGAVTTDHQLPIRFQVSDANEASLMIIDARFRADDFGTWTMEWHLNTDQTLVVREQRKVALEGAQAAAELKEPDIKWRRELTAELKAGIFIAQVQFQAGGYEDSDANGIGDFAGDLEVLSGQRLPKQAKAELGFLLPKDFIAKWTKAGIKHRMFAEREQGFWMFAALPSGSNTYAISAVGQVYELEGLVLPTSVQEAKDAIARATLYKNRR